MRDDYYYSGLYAEEQAEAEAQAKEAAHRQGPWHVSEYTDGRDALVYDKDGFEVARVCYPNRDADAKLIAAAPGLLAAIEAMRVAGGAAEFQAAFDKAKKLAMVHNVIYTTLDVL